LVADEWEIGYHPPCVRTFIAIEVGPELCSRLEAALPRLMAMAPETRWVRSDSLHLTLAFLGEVADSAIPAVSRALASVASAHEPFDLTARGSGTFGPLDAPKVLWVGIGGQVEALLALQRELTAAIAPMGLAPDHDVFQPHVTLGRAKHPRGDSALGRCGDTLRGSVFGGLQVREIALLSSETARDGSMRYIAISRHPLGSAEGG
jgi:RNA 2',3'-cyclic 3'-phosphodiesterase